MVWWLGVEVGFGGRNRMYVAYWPVCTAEVGVRIQLIRCTLNSKPTCPQTCHALRTFKTRAKFGF